MRYFLKLALLFWLAVPLALAQAPKAVPATAPSEPDAIPLQAEANASPATENRSATALLPTRYPLPVTR